MKIFHDNCTESFTKEHLNLTPLPHHEHLTSVSYIDPINQAIFFEYMENGTLENIQTKLSPTELLNILNQVCNTLHFMHTELYAVHADIKMDNIFIMIKKTLNWAISGFQNSNTTLSLIMNVLIIMSIITCRQNFPIQN